MSEYCPDRWDFVGIFHQDKLKVVKVIGEWHGSFTSGTSWRMNSGIKSVEKSEQYTDETPVWDVIGFSGSVYRVADVNLGVGSYPRSIVEDYQRQIRENDKFKDHEIRIIQVLPKDMNAFMKEHGVATD